MTTQPQGMPHLKHGVKRGVHIRAYSAAGTALLSCRVASLAWAFCFKVRSSIYQSRRY